MLFRSVSGKSIGGTGAVSVYGGISADTDLSTIAAAVDFNGDGSASIAIASGKSLTVKPSDADGKQVLGPGTLVLSSAIASSVDLRSVQAGNAGLVIPGVASGGTASLRVDQADGRTLSGAGSVVVDGVDAILGNASFRGVTTGS